MSGNERVWKGNDRTDKIKHCSVSRNRLDWKIPSSLGGSGGGLQETDPHKPTFININNKKIIWLFYKRINIMANHKAENPPCEPLRLPSLSGKPRLENELDK